MKTLEVGESYIKALAEKDIEKIKTYVHPAVEFKTPLMRLSGRDEFLNAARQFVAHLKNLQVRSKFSSENQAIFVYETVFDEPIGRSSAVNLMTFEGDLIKEFELFYDPRPFEKMMAAKK